ncbi:MBL fold metallo-hydrolase [Glycomyces paridis]|uniref:MBL fold metallo-hydrolase n=1 Tax=Glycomyces paridis TaxID=2126555 RepID=A0A4S8PN09_9ACTN|nr:MBL fold metallo-hydrolase [Glycomyces paridis]THV31215.1 MBL fold metallo-hydrolase [Glycomyces paridis]
MDDRWIEVADRVWARRLEELDQTLGLVTGDACALVIDTGVSAEAGYEFATAIRELTDLPWQVAYTHDHFDHWFGTQAFGESAVWAVGDGTSYVARGDEQRRAWAATYRRDGKEERARQIGATRLVPPNCRVQGSVGLDLGGRTVVLRQVGLAHSDNDMVVEVPDAGVLFAGDLLEEGAAPSYTGAFPIEWAQHVEYLLSWRPTIVVPGHGEPGDYWWARGQARDLAETARLCGEVAQGFVTEDEAVAHGPFGPETTKAAIERWRELTPPPAEPAPPAATAPAGPPPPTVVYEIFDYSLDLRP